MTYTRCPPHINGYGYYCYVVLDNLINDQQANVTCRGFNGLPVWVTVDHELQFLRELVRSYGRDCIHMGNFSLCLFYWLRIVCRNCYNFHYRHLLFEMPRVNMWRNLNHVGLMLGKSSFAKCGCDLLIYARFEFQPLCTLHISAGLFPTTDSFDLLRSDYLRSVGWNGSYVEGFAYYLQYYHLNSMLMGYCVDSGEMACKYAERRSLVCKIHCEYTWLLSRIKFHVATCASSY